MSFLQQSDEILSVSEFSRRFKMLVKTSVPELWISGEVSNLKTYQSGHTYFTLKDADASISAVLFKGNARAVSFPLKDGAKIFAFGEISLFEQRGTYQLIVRTDENEEDFVFDTEYTWNENDRVSVIIPKEKIKLTLKQEIKR